MIPHFYTLQMITTLILIITYWISNCRVLHVNKLREANLNTQTHPITHRLRVPEQVS